MIDLPVMRLCGLAIAVKNSRPEVLRESHYVTPHDGGHGAVRDAIEYVLREQGSLERVIDEYIGGKRVRIRDRVQRDRENKKSPSDGQGRVAHRRGSRFYTTILRVVSGAKHRLLAEVARCKKMLFGFRRHKRRQSRHVPQCRQTAPFPILTV